MLQEARARAEDLGELVHWLRVVTKTVENRHVELSRLVQQLSGMTKTNIRRLPPELLSIIFTGCWEDAETDEELNFTSWNRHITLILSHVCSQWRAIVLSDPRLWSRIILHFERRFNPAIARRITNLTRLFLDRSGSKPLDISVHTPTSEYELQPQYIHHRHVLNVLVKRAHRWRSAKFRIPYGKHLRLPASLPLLESLSIERIHDLFSDEREPWTYTYSLNAPRLRELKLSEDTLTLSPDLHWNSLTTLEMTCVEYEHLIGVLEQCSSLVSLSAQSIWGDPDDPNAIVTSQLGSLRLQDPWILEQIQLPRVSYLRIEDHAVDRIWDFDEIFHEFVLRSNPPVTTLCLINCSNKSRHVGGLSIPPAHDHQSYHYRCQLYEACAR
ncbi:hypothetical protein MPER_08302 [Moniliophthora perniciosa FA553]|nr:hypothetical protein MPER_08302 [Moniliophthora perniciosa FA553]